jgi:hypothetical protein
MACPVGKRRDAAQILAHVLLADRARRNGCKVSDRNIKDLVRGS